MVDKISKALAKFSAREKEAVKELLGKLKQGNFVGLDLKKLKGYSDIFRARKDKIRIIYHVKSGQIYLLAIERRNENTYRDI